ncbi:GNAT family N-acetyltransferase [Priestia endophytica]
MNIVDDTVALRAIEVEDASLLKSMINDPELEKMVLGWSFPVANHQQVEWIKRVNNDTKSVRFIIETCEEGAIGLASLTNIDYKNKTAIINIKLSSAKSRQKGLGFKVIKLLIKFAFDELNLNCLVANILKYNIASQKLFEKSGFYQEGVLRKRVYKQGAYQDVLSYSLIKEEYRNA